MKIYILQFYCHVVCARAHIIIYHIIYRKVYLVPNIKLYSAQTET